MYRNFVVFVIAVAAVVALSGPAMAWNLGDIFAAVGNGLVNRYDASGAFVETLNTGWGGGAFTTGMAFDASSNLYVTGFSNGDVVRFAPNSTLLGSFGSGYNGGVESLVFDQAGNMYAGHADGHRDIVKIDPAGTYLTQYDVAIEDRGSDWIDLAADQTTMFYTSEGGLVKRYDVGSNAQLADFASGLGGPAYALRLLSGGGLLVATTGNVKRLDAAGNIIQTYDVAGEDNWFALNLNPDGTSFWSGDFGTGNAYEFDLASGAMTQTIATGSGAFFGLAIYGEETVGGPVDVVPEPGTLALLGIGLAGAGFRLRRKK